MDTKTAAALAVLAVAAAGAITIGVGAQTDVDSTGAIPIAAAKQLGLAPDYAVYAVARSDGGVAYVALSKDDAGQDVKTLVDHSPCTKRPAKADPASCMKSTVDLSGKPVLVDPGDENTMQGGQGLGPGCVETACVAVFQ